MTKQTPMHPHQHPTTIIIAVVVVVNIVDRRARARVT